MDRHVNYYIANDAPNILLWSSFDMDLYSRLTACHFYLSLSLLTGSTFHLLSQGFSRIASNLVQVNLTLTLPPVPLHLPLATDPNFSATVSPPLAHWGPGPVHLRLISYELREGQVRLHRWSVDFFILDPLFCVDQRLWHEVISFISFSFLIIIHHHHCSCSPSLTFPH